MTFRELLEQAPIPGSVDMWLEVLECANIQANDVVTVNSLKQAIDLLTNHIDDVEDVLENWVDIYNTNILQFYLEHPDYINYAEDALESGRADTIIQALQVGQLDVYITWADILCNYLKRAIITVWQESDHSR